MKKYSFIALSLLILSSMPYAYSQKGVFRNKTVPVSLSQVKVDGELRVRILKNFDRLEEEKYQPANVFLTDQQSGHWPGDTEGRTILGLVRDAQASGREPKYLKEIIRLIPQKLNEKGYMGKVYPYGTMDEQQLSGNGWFISGLIEYYKWKKDENVLGYIKSIINNLFLPGKGFYKSYPIDPNVRTSGIGEAIGTVDKKVDNWMLSTDIGCLFIGMDGAINAYKLLPSKELKEVIDEMIERFLLMDLVAVKAQTHASLTAMRGLLTYAEVTGNKKLINEVVKRWDLYRTYGMTENYANYNWFTRYDAATEPCAIVDSYIVISRLWELTQDPQYLPELDLIYYNAISHGQRENGGFGTDRFQPIDLNSLTVQIPEAHWCCTMRGGDGLSSVAECAYFTKRNSLYVVHYVDNKATLNFSKNSFLCIEQKTNYPFGGEVNMEITDARNAKSVAINLNALTDCTENINVFVNGEKVNPIVENGFITLKNNWKKNDKIKFTFDNKIRIINPLNKENYTNNLRKVIYGSLLLGYSGTLNVKLPEKVKIRKISPSLFQVVDTDIVLSPVYHLLDKKVIKGDTYKKQVLF
ncbi:MAG: hypothetical protein GZ091_08645 [Paludibacter sp.]|nr:hypothetical protein [Paludibacter sp.]